jgi:hypothetical protein
VCVLRPGSGVTVAHQAHKPKPLYYSPTFDQIGSTITVQADGGQYSLLFDNITQATTIADDHSGSRTVLGTPPDGAACNLSSPVLGGGWVAYPCTGSDDNSVPLTAATYDLYRISRASWASVKGFGAAESTVTNFVRAVGTYWLQGQDSCDGIDEHLLWMCAGGPWLGLLTHSVWQPPQGNYATDPNQPTGTLPLCSPLTVPTYMDSENYTAPFKARGSVTLYAHGYAVAQTGHLDQYGEFTVPTLYLERCKTHLHEHIGDVRPIGNSKIILWRQPSGIMQGILLSTRRPVRIRVPSYVLGGNLQISDRNIYIGNWWTPLPAAAR